MKCSNITVNSSNVTNSTSTSDNSKNTTVNVSPDDWFLLSIKSLIPSQLEEIPQRRGLEDFLSINITSSGTKITINTPPIGDFCDKIHLRHPGYSDADWLLMRKIDPVEFRQYEERIRLSIDEVNQQDGYISPAALINWEMHNILGIWNNTICSD